ncbi:Histone H1oo isoform X2 [Aix galericulata]|nr:Histone H1oo isoform X2 [Aix galericulata]
MAQHGTAAVGCANGELGAHLHRRSASQHALGVCASAAPLDASPSRKLLPLLLAGLPLSDTRRPSCSLGPCPELLQVLPYLPASAASQLGIGPTHRLSPHIAPSPTTPAAGASEGLGPLCQPGKAAGAARLSSQTARGQRHPPTLNMVIEALRAQDGTKGASVVTIKRFILAKYPAVDPVRLKYLLKQALAKGLSRGDLVRPHNSSALGATGRFKLAPEKLRQKQPPRQADPTGGQAPKPGRRGAAKATRVPAVLESEGGPGTAEEKPKATKQKPKAAKQKPRTKPADAQPAPAAAKPRSDGAKAPRAPAKGRSAPRAALAANDKGGNDGDCPVGAGAKGTRKAPAGKTKGKVPGEAQEAAPKEKGAKGKTRKPQAARGAGQGQAAP